MMIQSDPLIITFPKRVEEGSATETKFMCLIAAWSPTAIVNHTVGSG